MRRSEWPVLLWVILATTNCGLLVGDGDYTVGGDGSAASGASGTASGSSGTATGGAGGTASGSSGTATGGAGGAATGASGAGGSTSGAGPTDGGMRADSNAPPNGMDAASPDKDAAPAADAGGIPPTPDAGSAPPDAGSATCPVATGDDSCTTCNKMSCCTAVNNCATDCGNILTCLKNCTASPCGCLAQFPAGVTTFLALLTCQNTQCTADCGFFDDGDPCVTSDSCLGDCGSTAPHSGLWCTNACFASTDCVNEETASGDDIFGEVSSCVDDQGTSTCFPGCLSPADCQAYPGTICGPATTVENDTVSVCHQ